MCVCQKWPDFRPARVEIWYTTSDNDAATGNDDDSNDEMKMMTMMTMMITVQVIQRLDDECMRSRKFLNASSYAKVTHECQQRMIADHLQFLHGECRAMVHKEKRHGLYLCLFLCLCLSVYLNLSRLFFCFQRCLILFFNLMFSFQISLNRTDHRQKKDFHVDIEVRGTQCCCIELARVKCNYSEVHCIQCCCTERARVKCNYNEVLGTE